jgi:uncharacterized protein YbjQ (UPF0145 family)
VLVTTTPSIDGARIERYIGLVSGEAVFGMDVLKGMAAAIKQIGGGRAAAFETELRKARSEAIRQMTQEAYRRGGSAIVGARLDFENIGGMLMVCASGTAVVVDDSASQRLDAELRLTDDSATDEEVSTYLAEEP